MLKEEFGELESLRKLYRKKKTQKLEKQRALQECRNKVKDKVNDLKLELKFKKADMLKNKELRAQHDISNDNVWKQEIDKITRPDQDKINQTEKDADEQIKELETCIEDLQLEISDIHWELTIKLEYYKDSPVIQEINNLETIAIGE